MYDTKSATQITSIYQFINDSTKKAADNPIKILYNIKTGIKTISLYVQDETSGQI